MLSAILFVQTEILRQREAIICTRRPRSVNEQSPWMFHLMAVKNTDSSRDLLMKRIEHFIGRGSTIANPLVMGSGETLSGSQGSVLNPIVSIRSLITLDP